ncbi:Tyrosine aminotransferase [Phytophthora citrophthora]|uniref:Tyrosine aminotransferase n=1 Tax=Phytophthora citrophthora TaxID=4793 RepID=A0AAD9LSR4_9STRA|nr:Tyrosine aminotransferase [Phytophthora citrophthora]
MTKTTAFDDPTVDVPMVDANRQEKLHWNVQPSEFSNLCSNPIRKIVDNIKKPAASTKTLIPLSLGGYAGRCNCDIYTSKF